MQQSFIFGCVVGIGVHDLEYVPNIIASGGCEDYSSPQPGEHFGSVEVHRPMRVCTVLPREFGFRPFRNEISQNLRFNSSAWSIYDFEGEEFYSPFGYTAGGISIVDYVIQWYFGCHRN